MPKTIRGGDHTVITLDAEKAFNNVSLEWLSTALSEMGFTGPFKHLVNAMYASPAARLVAAGLLSEEFCLYKGTRQGCPLSLLLFNLALEPLSRYLTQKAPLHGINIGNQELRTSLFADDVLIFTVNPSSDMSTISVFDKFVLGSPHKLQQKQNPPHRQPN